VSHNEGGVKRNRTESNRSETNRKGIGPNHVCEENVGVGDWTK